MAAGTVLVVDDEQAVRTSLGRLLRSAGYDVETIGSAQEMLSRGRPGGVACAIVDLQLGDNSGLALQESLRRAAIELPLVFLSGRGDVRSTAKAMLGGAVDFLTKPVEEEELLRVIERALERDRAAREDSARRMKIEGRLGTLTDRERDVFELIVTGMLNKQVGCELGIAEKTVKLHRAQVMRKMGVESIAQLVRMAQSLGR
jgi:FixJ family two-component response regulator